MWWMSWSELLYMSALVNMSIMSRWKWSVVLIVPPSTFFFIVVRSIGLKFKAKDHKTKRENSFFIDMRSTCLKRERETTRHGERKWLDMIFIRIVRIRKHYIFLVSIRDKAMKNGGFSLTHSPWRATAADGTHPTGMHFKNGNFHLY